MAALVQNLEKLLEPAVRAVGCELWAVEYVAQGPHSRLRLYIDSPQGITVDDCERVSRQVSGVLDVEDPIRGEYTLEVSSPGLDRPLLRLDHFRRFIGSRLQVRLREARDGRRRYSGTIESVAEDVVQVRDDETGAVLALRVDEIEKANLVPEV